MTEQELQNAGGARAEANASLEADLARQKEIFLEREEELLEKHPQKSLAVCGGDVFAGNDDDDALSKAEAAHPDRPIYLCSPDASFPCECDKR